MSVMLRVCLIAASVLTMILMMQKIRRSKVQIEDALFWVFFSFILILFSVFPKVAYLLSDLVGTEAPSNCIFLLVIFLLLVKVFSLSVRISQLETKLKELVQKIAIGEADKDEDK
jgi:hypothetical protein